VLYRTSRRGGFGGNWLYALREVAMRSIIETTSQQIFAVVGSAYISEHHSDETHRYLPPSEKHDFTADFAEILKNLRAALSLG
jgi:hypothetical protein